MQQGRRDLALSERAISSVVIWTGLIAALLLAGALFSPAADAHVQKNKQGLYVLAVDRWRQAAKLKVTQENEAADLVTDMAENISSVTPPEDANEEALLQYYENSAAQWESSSRDMNVAQLSAFQKGMNKWEKKVKPWFSKASDKRALEHAADAYMKGMAHLLHEAHGDLTDAAAALKNGDVGTANGDVAVGVGAIALAEKELNDAVAALSRLTN